MRRFWTFLAARLGKPRRGSPPTAASADILYPCGCFGDKEGVLIKHRDCREHDELPYRQVSLGVVAVSSCICKDCGRETARDGVIHLRHDCSPPEED
jgi:hypothetical protein